MTTPARLPSMHATKLAAEGALRLAAYFGTQTDDGQPEEAGELDIEDIRGSMGVLSPIAYALSPDFFR